MWMTKEKEEKRALQVRLAKISENNHQKTELYPKISWPLARVLKLSSDTQTSWPFF